VIICVLRAVNPGPASCRLRQRRPWNRRPLAYQQSQDRHLTSNLPQLVRELRPVSPLRRRTSTFGTAGATNALSKRRKASRTPAQRWHPTTTTKPSRMHWIVVIQTVRRLKWATPAVRRRGFRDISRMRFQAAVMYKMVAWCFTVIDTVLGGFAAKCRTGEKTTGPGKWLNQIAL